MDFSIPAYLSDFSTQDDQRTIAKLKMFYVGETGDGRVFDKEFSDKLVNKWLLRWKWRIKTYNLWLFKRWFYWS
mgnify:CR=1 FL=1